MNNRTYRYFTGQPLFPFGHGLSYTEFEYSHLTLGKKFVHPDKEITLSVDVKNTGEREGDEVVQLYAQAISPKKPHAIKELRGFKRIHLVPGETKTVHFTIKPNKDLTRYDTGSKKYVVDTGKYQLQVGASSEDIRVKDVLSVR